MNAFIRYVLWELKNSMFLVILAGALGTAVLAVAWLVHKKRHGNKKSFPWGKAFCWLMLAGYLALVVYATVFRHSGGFREWNLHLFRAWREAWNHFSVKLWANVLLNIAMFLPMGILPQLLGKWPRKWYFGIGLGFAVSLAIELLQLAAARGICDIDDLFANTLGTAMGFCAMAALRSLTLEKRKRMKPVLIYGCLTLIPVLTICGIFVAYRGQEYGNLPDAASYTNRTGGVEWNLACVLSEEEGTAAVYKTRAMDKKDCDAFAEKMARLAGQEVLMGSYYEEMAYYNLSRGTLTVNYYDGSYKFGIFSGEHSQRQMVDREILEKQLADYGISVPRAAVLTSEENGWWCFRCQGYTDGDSMTDGTLRVRCGEDYTLFEIESTMVQYRHYKEVPVISSVKACELLMAGKFGDGGYFAYRKPEDVTVVSCELEYRIDTKGFYRPVYIFGVASVSGSYRDSIMIPAMK